MHVTATTTNKMKKELTWINGRPWKSNQDDKYKIEDQIEEEIDMTSTLANVIIFLVHANKTLTGK